MKKYSVRTSRETLDARNLKQALELAVEAHRSGVDVAILAVEAHRSGVDVAILVDGEEVVLFVA